MTWNGKTPSLWQRSLAQGHVTLRLNGARITELIERISRHDPALGHRLAGHAHRLEYTAIQRTLQAANELSPPPT